MHRELMSWNASFFCPVLLLLRFCTLTGQMNAKKTMIDCVIIIRACTWYVFWSMSRKLASLSRFFFAFLQAFDIQYWYECSWHDIHRVLFLFISHLQAMFIILHTWRKKKKCESSFIVLCATVTKTSRANRNLKNNNQSHTQTERETHTLWKKIEAFVHLFSTGYIRVCLCVVHKQTF